MSEEILAEMVANVWKVLVGPGDDVSEGDTICILVDEDGDPRGGDGRGQDHLDQRL